MKNKVVKDKLIDKIIYLGKKSLDLLAGICEILIHHFFKIGSFLSSRVNVLGNNMPYLLQCQNIMRSLILLMESNASFCFANSSFVRTGEAASQLHYFDIVNIAKSFFIFGMSKQHVNYNKNLI